MKGSQVASGSRIVEVLVALLLLGAATLKGGDAIVGAFTDAPHLLLKAVNLPLKTLTASFHLRLEEAIGEVDGDESHEAHENGVGVDGHVCIVPLVWGVVK